MDNKESKLGYYSFLLVFFFSVFFIVLCMMLYMRADIFTSVMAGLLIAGLGFIAEHKAKWGYLEFEPLGHETYGLVISCCSVIALLYKRLKKSS